MTIKSMIRKWVRENFGESEVNDPSWNIDLLAEYIESKLETKRDNTRRAKNILEETLDLIDCGRTDWDEVYDNIKKAHRKL